MCDHLGAIVIAMLLRGIGVFAAKNNINQLLDRVPAQEFFDKVKMAAMRINGVLATEKSGVNSTGPRRISVSISKFRLSFLSTGHLN